MLPLAAMPLCFFFISCYPDFNLSAAEYDVVVSLYDPSNIFSAYRTYAMPDSILRLDSTNSVTAYDVQIINAIKNNMTSLGYQRIINPDSLANRPDVIIIPRVGTWTNTTVPWSNWDFYFPYYPDWAWSYPWYPTTEQAMFTRGSLVIDMIDMNKLDTTNQQFVSVWFGVLNALLDNSTAVDLQLRITNGINQVFNQSPYLRVN
jgi:hypothetical protein